MKTKILTCGILLFSIFFIYSNLPFTQNQERIFCERVYDHIQNETSKMCGKQFSLIPEKDRKGIYHEAENLLYGTCSRTALIEKSEIRQAVVQALTHYAGKLTEKIASELQSTTLTVKEVRKLYEQKIEKECRNNLSENKFQQYLDQQFIYQTIQHFNASYHSLEESKNKSSQSNPLYALWNWLFPHYPDRQSFPIIPAETTVSSYQSTPFETPSAPTLSDIFSVHNPHMPKIPNHPSDICSIAFQCDKNLKETNTESYYLPCGHNFCKLDLNNWLFENNNSTCPNCRYTLTYQERAELKNAFNVKNICARCNKQQNLNRLICSHYMCDICINSWIHQTESVFSHKCPRCYQNVF